MRSLAAVLRVFATFGAAFATMTTAAWACTCIATTADDAVDSGDAVVLVRVEEVRGPRGCAGNGPLRASVEVQEVIAGPGEVGVLDVQTQADGGECGLELVEGETWILQVTGDESWVTLCTASRRVEGADDPWVVELRAAAAN